MKIIIISVALLAYLNAVCSERILQNGQPFADIRRIGLRRPGYVEDQSSHELSALSQLVETRALHPQNRDFSERSGIQSRSSQEKTRPLPFVPSPQDPLPDLLRSSEDLSPYRPRPEHRPQTPSFAAGINRFAEQAQEESRNTKPQDFLNVDERKRPSPVASMEDATLFRKNPERQMEEELARVPDQTDRRRPHFPKQIVKSRIPPPSPSQERPSPNVYPANEDEMVLLRSSETFEFPRRESELVQREPVQYQKLSRSPELVPVKSYSGSPEAPKLFRVEEPLKKVHKRKKVIVDDARRFEKDFKKDKRDIEVSETNVDPNAVQFAHDVHHAEAAGAKEGRIAFQLHGLQGPHSYRFGYDTGKGYNRQFRYEERDNHGEVKGRYGYYDNHGKLHIVNYSAHPKHGFAADVPKY